jgi:hypothetical protein
VYAGGVSQTQLNQRKKRSLKRAAVEVAFIIFLFYSNLLMGEFTRSSRPKSFVVALADIFTPANFAIALFSGTVGFFVFEGMRKQI